MSETRRRFVLSVASAVAASFGGVVVAQDQNPRPFPADPSKRDDDSVPLPGTKAILEENQKDIKKSVEKLFQLASDLRAEVEKTNSVQVLSLSMLRKAEEIEKLAHDIKVRAKG
jgi:nucleotide-binding universal stress UspA family protein